MKKLISTTALVAVLALTAGVSAAGGAEQGKELFQKKMCAACHGPGKKGGDLAATKMDKGSLDKFLKDPKAVNPKVAGMPAFKGTDAERAALVDYIMSLKK